jgi:hypothetical protein
MTSQLLINNTPLDLPSDSLIALSYAVNTLTDLKTVQGNISNTIALPDTANNRAALGYPADMNFNGAGIIRQKLPCKYIQNGVEVIPQGNLRITGASKGAINVVLTSGNTDFFDLLTGKLRDLDFSEYDHIWNQDNVIASRLNTEGYLYPIINYNNLSNTTDIRGNAIYPAEMRPAVFVKTLVQKIIAQAGTPGTDGVNVPAGYTLINQIEADPVTAPIYNKLLLPFSTDKFTHSQRYTNLYSGQNIKVQQNATLSYPHYDNGTVVSLPFNVSVADTAHLFDGTYWAAPQIMTVDVNVSFPHIHINRSGSVDDNINGIYMKMYKIPAGGSTDLAAHPEYKIYEPANLPFDDADASSGHDRDIFNYTMQLNGVRVNPGDKLVIAMETAGHSGSTSVTFYPGSELDITLNSDDMLYGEPVQLEAVLPDMTCTDFLKFIQFYFCAIIQTDNVAKTVTIVPFGHIKQNMPVAVDWSSRVTNADDDIDVQIGDYCQQNEAKWKHDDTVSPDTYANGSFYIPDANLPLYQDIYDLPFAASFEQLVLGNFNTTFINKIPDITATDQNGLIFNTQTQSRLVLLNSQNATIKYRNADASSVVTATGNIPFTYFTATDGSPDLTLPSIIKNHYTDLVNVLSDQRKLTTYLRLTEIDIQTLDFFKPIYIQKYAAYFYLSKITDFTGIKPVKVELIRL